jgi:hypothetical protein
MMTQTNEIENLKPRSHARVASHEPAPLGACFLLTIGGHVAGSLIKGANEHPAGSEEQEGF